jgi:hypothetical protein
VPWAATLLARSQLLEGAGGPYFGSARGDVSLLASAIKNTNIIKRIFQKNFFVFELQWALLVFAFWHRQKTGFEASERNKDASHAPTARKLIF